MAIQISPGVSVSEVDLTTTVPSVLTTAGAFVGNFSWGPANTITTVTSEIDLVNTFGKPSDNTAISFFSAANFLAYGNNLKIVRGLGTTSNNATGVIGAGGSASALKVENEDVFQSTYLLTNSGATSNASAIVARYAGALGNGLGVSICDSSANFTTWPYKGNFQSAPGTSDYASNAGASVDEMHIVVLDRTGAISGTANSVLEKFGYVSKASDAVTNGQSNYYKQVLFDQSRYIYVASHPDYANTNATWGTAVANGKTYSTGIATAVVALSGGIDDNATDGNLQSGWDLFSNSDTTDISLMITGDSNTTVQNYVVSTAGSRKDCLAFVSPPSANVVNKTDSTAATNVGNWIAGLTKSSYAVADSGWKYQFDKYNNTYRWIPLNADVAGLCVYTDSVRDPWFSPAGFARGTIKNAIKLAWNPNKTYRDTLYAAGVNPVVSFAGQGTVLYGDKTMLNRPSAFDRINVRRLFIILEKAIANAAQFSLFELNDEFTRAQFVSYVTPFLRDIQGRRGITDFKVVCDETNNTPQVIDSNQFVGDIYIKPARSVNYIQLNFVAVATGVDFTTIVGAV